MLPPNTIDSSSFPDHPSLMYGPIPPRVASTVDDEEDGFKTATRVGNHERGSAGPIDHRNPSNPPQFVATSLSRDLRGIKGCPLIGMDSSSSRHSSRR
ncbi:hypothetical protein CEXT_483421 [Caerostris extrusa]|uniref:Uncharacterized protein n=1 Tax=Caerostris extrusa TaxID=172846 RepID=A0AAV4X2Y4_CAEEX|nr:hypothetical protein CEXT_483421 [Caerostris extrusa]